MHSFVPSLRVYSIGLYVITKIKWCLLISLLKTAWHGEPDVVTRYMGYAAVQMQADVKDGFSSNVAMNDLKKRW